MTEADLSPIEMIDAWLSTTSVRSMYPKQEVRDRLLDLREALVGEATRTARHTATQAESLLGFVDQLETRISTLIERYGVSMPDGSHLTLHVAFMRGILEEMVP